MKYFAYGSNMSSEELCACCPSAEFLSTARLPDHRLDFTRYSSKRQGGVADIVQSTGDEVWGVLYEIPPAELPALDGKEGVATAAYERTYVEVITTSGERVGALSYAVVRKAPTEPPHRAYLDIILSGAREHALPVEYVGRLEQIATRDR